MQRNYAYTQRTGKYKTLFLSFKMIHFIKNDRQHFYLHIVNVNFKARFKNCQNLNNLNTY